MARTTTLTPEERAEKRRAYQREYARTHREQKDQWAKDNPDKYKEVLKKANEKYKKANASNRTLQFLKNTDSDIINYLESVDNFNAYIKRLIREDMSRNKPEK